MHSHAGRLGGDEFAVLLPLALHESRRVAEHLRDEVSRLDLPQLPQLACSVSIGLAAIPVPGTALRDWVESADRALYRAKQAGRNRT
jgi:diguanylate cyclase